MTKVVDYYLTPISPWAYLGSAGLAEILERHRAGVRVKPLNFGALLSRTGGLPLPKRSPERQAYRLVELARWKKHLGVPINLQPKYFPVPDELAARLIVAAGRSGGRPLELAQAMGRAIWEEERNLAETGTLLEVARATGHLPEALMAAALDPTTRQILQDHTEEAVANGVFGAPTYRYNGENFWGQDRLNFLDRALGED